MDQSDEEITAMKAKFNQLLANFEREEVFKPENAASVDLGSNVGTAYFNSQENNYIKRTVVEQKNSDGKINAQSPQSYGDEDYSD